ERKRQAHGRRQGERPDRRSRWQRRARRRRRAGPARPRGRGDAGRRRPRRPGPGAGGEPPPPGGGPRRPAARTRGETQPSTSAATVSYFGSTKPASVDLAAGTGVADGTDQLKNVESVVGTKRDDTLKGDANGNSLQGGDGNDVLSGGGGADFLDGGVGSNTLDGGPGSDYCLQRGRSCEGRGAPFIPGKAPLPPGVTPPALFSFVPALLHRADGQRVL